MSIFTKINKEFVNDIQKQYKIEISKFFPISSGLDNSVYKLFSQNQILILKIFEGKNKNRIQKILCLYNLLKNEKYIIHNYIKNEKSENFACFNKKYYGLLNFVEGDLGKFNNNLLIKKIDRLHSIINKKKGGELVLKGEEIIFNIYNETLLYYNFITKDVSYLKKYKKFDIYKIMDEYNVLYNKCIDIYKKNRLGLIHNDINKSNIIINKINQIEIIDYDGFKYDILVKDYIIVLIRFNLFNKIGELFCYDKKVNKYNIGGHKLNNEEIFNLAKFYLINLILNMIYYIGYDKKGVNDKNFKKNSNNQNWYELFVIYKNLNSKL